MKSLLGMGSGLNMGSVSRADEPPELAQRLSPTDFPLTALRQASGSPARLPEPLPRARPHAPGRSAGRERPSDRNIDATFVWLKSLVLGFAFLAVLCASGAQAQDAATNSSGNSANSAAAQNAPQNTLSAGNKLYEKGDYTGAAEQYRKAALTSKNVVDKAFAWFNLGNCHVQTKSYNKAIVAYRRSIEESPFFTRAWMVLGEVYYTMGAVGDAFPCFRRVIEIDGPNLRAYQMLGELALQAGDIAEALQNFEAALKIDPDQADIYLAMAEADTRIRDYASAQKVMDEALLILPNPPAEAYFYLGQLHELGGNDRKAVRAYEEGLLIDPKRTEYYMRIAGIHEHNGDDFLALLTLEQAVHAGIKKPEIRLKRGMLFFAQKRYDHALEEYQAAYALGSQQGRSGIENISAVYFNAGDKKKAEEVTALLDGSR
jgi:tetratricopeptide (TPR) repeat protein